MKEAWATAIVLQHWLWVALKYFLAIGAGLCVLAIVLGLAVGKYYGREGKRKNVEKR